LRLVVVKVKRKGVRKEEKRSGRVERVSEGGKV